MSKLTGVNTPEKHFTQLGLLWQSFPSFLNLPKDRRLAITNKLTNLTAEGFMRDGIAEELVHDVENHVAESPRLFLLHDNNDTPKAYICAEVSIWRGYSVYELGGIIIHPSLQQKGLGLSMIQTELDDVNPDILILRTQNNSMYKLAAKVAILDEKLAAKMAPTYYPTNLDGCINHGVYRNGGSLYGDIVHFESQAIPSIDWKSGDGLVVAGFIKKI